MSAPANVPGPAEGRAAFTSAGVERARTGFGTVVLHYRDAAAIRVRGPVSGRSYEFSQAAPSQSVDVRDAAVLLRGEAFRR